MCSPWQDLTINAEILAEVGAGEYTWVREALEKLFPGRIATNPVAIGRFQSLIADGPDDVSDVPGGISLLLLVFSVFLFAHEII